MRQRPFWYKGLRSAHQSAEKSCVLTKSVLIHLLLDVLRYIRHATHGLWNNLHPCCLLHNQPFLPPFHRTVFSLLLTPRTRLPLPPPAAVDHVPRQERPPEELQQGQVWVEIALPPSQPLPLHTRRGHGWYNRRQYIFFISNFIIRTEIS